MRTLLAVRITNLWWSLLALLFAVASLVVFVLTVVGVALVVVTAGIPFVLGGAALTRWLADAHRRLVPRVDRGEPMPSPYLRAVPGGPVARLLGLARDPARRRDLYWVGLNGSVGLALTMVGLVESVLDLVFWWLPAGVALRVHAALCRALLAPSEKSRLALRVEQLADSRAETVDFQAGELRRIERDLHDGAQARMVSLGMSLVLAEKALDHDPAQARALLGEARTANTQALGELRDLVRGIHPPVLADRGLVGAVRAVALAAPIPVEVVSDLDQRLPAPVESAAYFVVAEAITNVVKHSGAGTARIDIHYNGVALRIGVRDDGSGGADPRGGTGLAGIARRLSAFDGRLEIDSPPGGPTQLAMVLPCASSSPKTSPSSATD